MKQKHRPSHGKCRKLSRWASWWVTSHFYFEKFSITIREFIIFYKQFYTVTCIWFGIPKEDKQHVWQVKTSLSENGWFIIKKKKKINCSLKTLVGVYNDISKLSMFCWLLLMARYMWLKNKIVLRQNKMHLQHIVLTLIWRKRSKCWENHMKHLYLSKN